MKQQAQSRLGRPRPGRWMAGVFLETVVVAVVERGVLTAVAMCPRACKANPPTLRWQVFARFAVASRMPYGWFGPIQPLNCLRFPSGPLFPATRPRRPDDRSMDTNPKASVTDDADVLAAVNVAAFPDGQAVNQQALFGNTIEYDDDGNIAAARAMFQVCCALRAWTVTRPCENNHERGCCWLGF